MGNGNETVKWQQFALVPSQLQLQGYPHIQGDIWKLWAVSGNLTIWLGNYTLDSGDSLGPFHVNLHVNKSYSTMACVKYPFACYMGIGPGMILWGLCHVVIVI